jgi:hypothetical protein
MPINNLDDLRLTIRTAETIASRLVTPGHTLNSMGERRHISALLTDLATFSRRVFDPAARDDWTREPRGDLDNDGETLDLFGVFP